MRAIIAQNMEQRELSIEMKHQLVGEMKGTFLKLLDQKAFTEYSDIESVKRRVIDIGSSESLETIQNEFLTLWKSCADSLRIKERYSYSNHQAD